MTFYSVSNPFMQVLNLQGTGLNDGDVYFGIAGQDPITHPITVYWDLAGTDEADQPIPTTGGYLYRSGTPAAVYLDDTYSIKVLDKKGGLVYYEANVFDPVFELIEQIAELEATTLRTYATRTDMADAPGAVMGATAYLSESFRAGDFKVVSSASYTAAITADPYQAYFVPVTGQPSLVWMRQFVGRADFEWGGADPTGTNDSGAQINAMLANPYYAAFQLGNGIYQSSAPIGTTATTAISIVGLGVESSMFSINGNYDALKFEFANPVHGLELKDFSIQNLATTPTSGAALRLAKSYDGRIENLSTFNTYDGFHGTQCALSTYRNFHVNRCFGDGQRYDGGNSFNESWYDCVFSGDTTAINGFNLIDMCDKFTWIACTFSTFINAGVTDAASFVVNQRPEFLRFYACDFDSCQNGPLFEHAYDVASNGCFFSCRPNNGVSFGISKGAAMLSSTNDTYYFCGKSAVVIGALADGVILGADNRYISCGNTTANTYDTISVVTGIAQGPFQIEGGDFRIDPTVVTQPRYMIHIATGASIEYDIGPCRGVPGTTGFMLDETKGANRTIHNMPALYPTVTHGTATISAGGTVSYAHGLAEQPMGINQIQITPQAAISAVADIGVATGFPDATHITITGGNGRSYSVTASIAGN